MRSILLYFIVFIVVKCNCQNMEWTKLFCAVNNMQPIEVEVDLNGNVYAGGRFTGTIDFDPGPGTAIMNDPDFKWDGYLVKLDKYGNYKWSFQYAGTDLTQVQQIIYDNNSSIYVNGTFGGTVDFDPSPTGSFNMTSAIYWEGFIAKYDTSGKFIWAKQLGGSPFNGNNTRVYGDKIYTTGTFGGVRDFDPGVTTFTMNSLSSVFLTKLDTSGNFKWAKEFKGGTSISGIDIDKIGNIYIAADFDNMVDLDPSPLQYTAGIGSGNYVVKLDSGGSFKWAKVAVKSTGSNGRTAAIRVLDNDIKVVGTYQYNFDIDPSIGTFNLPYSLYLDAFIWNLDTSGNLQWGKQIDGISDVSTLDFEIDNNGNGYIVGEFYDTTNFDPGLTNYSLSTFKKNFISPYLVMYDKSGSFKFAGKLRCNNRATIYAVNSNVSNIYITGLLPDTADFNLSSPPSYTFSCGNTGSIFVEKLGNIYSGINEFVSTQGKIAVSPNPSYGKFSFYFYDKNEVKLNTDGFKFEIYNSLG